jgi:hypothetical protein
MPRYSAHSATLLICVFAGAQKLPLSYMSFARSLICRFYVWICMDSVGLRIHFVYICMCVDSMHICLRGSDLCVHFVEQDVYVQTLLLYFDL